MKDKLCVCDIFDSHDFHTGCIHFMTDCREFFANKCIQKGTFPRIGGPTKTYMHNSCLNCILFRNSHERST